jgi:uncharacterized glyoxalase superfamily protein PhnB
MPTIREVCHVIAVTNLDEATRYYRDVLGFEVEDRGAPGWRWYLMGSAIIMAGHCPDAIPAKEIHDHSYFLRITLEGIDAYYQAVSDRGAEFASKIEDKPYGFREFCVRTNDGHRIVFASRL